MKSIIILNLLNQPVHVLLLGTGLLWVHANVSLLTLTIAYEKKCERLGQFKTAVLMEYILHKYLFITYY